MKCHGVSAGCQCLLVIVIVLCWQVPDVHGQDWLNRAIGDAGAKKKAALDSIDFQFVMSVNESSGFMDVENKGEGWSRVLYTYRAESDKTAQELARESLEVGLAMYQLNRHRLAETSFQATKLQMETNGLTGDINYLRCISNLGVVYLIQANTFLAEEYVTRALHESRVRLGEASPAYAANLNSRAKLEQLLGKYSEAEQTFDEAHHAVVQAFGEKTMQHAIVLNNKAMLLQGMGRFDEAVKLLEQAIQVVESAPKKLLEGKKSFDARRFQTNLALLHQLRGDAEKAEQSFLALKKIYENRMQTGNNEYAQLCNQLAILYIQMGKPGQVEELLKKAGKIYKSKYKEESPAYAKYEYDLGNFYRITKRYAEAETSLQKAMGIRQRTLGETHPDYAKSVESLGILYWKKGDWDRASTLLREAVQKSLHFINSYFPPMSEAEKTKYWDILQPRFQRFYNFALDYHTVNPAVLEEVFNYQIATKALLLNSTNKVKQAILRSGDEALVKDYMSWVGQKEMLARYYALSKEELLQQKIDLAALEKQANDLERSLSARSSDFSKGFASQEVTFSQVRERLQPQDALVEIVRIRSFDQDFTDGVRYAALVVTRQKPQPELIVMENGKEMETRYAKLYKNSIIHRLDDESSYDQYWGRLDPALAGKKAVFISPDGVYNQLNVNTLKPADGQPEVLKRFDIVIIGNAKDLLALRTTAPARQVKKNAVLLGSPDYGGNAVPLPGTRVEVEQVNKILKAAGFTTRQLVSTDATERNIKEMKTPTLVHIATHGYFLADHELSAADAMGINTENARSNPLLRSGLLLTGMAAPNQKTAPDLQSNDNGILTAFEATNLALEGTDLVILSACETGLGDVRAGEGVYGMQRAFLVAGAQALVMSLWKVDDAATQQLMTNFYTQLTKTNDKAKAFKMAQLQLMAKYPEPYYWGAFVMMGM